MTIFRTVSRRYLTYFVAASALTFCTFGTVYAKTVDLRVLVIATGSSADDPGRALMEGLLNQLQTPYDVFDASQEDLTAQRLSSGESGAYNGVILTDSGAAGHFSKDEWDTLYAYERDFAVRQSVVSGWPYRWADGGIDYGLEPTGDLSASNPGNAKWLSPAGGTEYFEYVNTSKALPITDAAFLAKPGVGGPTVTPLLAVDGNADQTLVALANYADGREVLVSTVTNAGFLLHSQVLAYEFLNFATKGVFLGARKVYLATHVDDLFLADALWNTELNATPEAGQSGHSSYRMDGHDVLNAIAAQTTLRAKRTVPNSFVLDFPFNGEGADLATAEAFYNGTLSTLSNVDSLTAEIVANRSKLRFINHTYSHRQMDRGITSYQQAKSEITQNRQIWGTLGLPQRSANSNVLVSGNHSGLKDDMGTELYTADDVPYPAGKNDEFLRAARDAGITYLASDSSQLNQDKEAFVPGFKNVLLLPRWPTALFYNVSTPQEWVDEYNYIFYDRWIEAGENPANIPGAIPRRFTYQEILQFEAELNLRHLLTYRMWPYFFHVANLRDYDGNGSTLLFDWLHAVVDEYEQYLTLPVQTLPYYEIGDYTKRRVKARDATIDATLDLATNQVTFLSNATVFVEATGLTGGSVYGGQRQRWVKLSAGSPLTINVNRLTNQ